MGKIRRISKNLKNVVYLCFFGATLSASTNFLLNFGPVFAASSSNGTDQIQTNLSATSVSISTSGDVSFDIVPTSSGTLGVGSSTVTVTTSASSGYKLYISGPNIDTNGFTSLYLDGVTTSLNKLIGIPSSTPITFPATNQWGYAVPGQSGFSSLSNYQNAASSTSTNGHANSYISNTTWKGLNTNYQPIASSSSSGSSSSTIYYAAYADASMMPGNYKNYVIYTAFTEGSSRAALANSYVQNNSDLEITVEYQSQDYIPTSDIIVTLYDDDTATTVGSCTSPTVVSGTGQTNPLKIRCYYSSNANATYGAAYDVRVTFPIGGTTFAYIGDDAWVYDYPPSYLQSQTAITTCKNASEGSSFTLQDYRDNKYYYVTKLKDGNCWMTQNLDLDLAVEGSTMGTTKDGSFVAFTGSNTDISGSTWTIPSTSQAYATQTTTGTIWNQYGCANDGSSNAWVNNSSSAYHYNKTTWCSSDQYYEVRSYDPGMTCLTNGTTNATCDPNTLGSANHYHDGNYYNWPAATAGTGTYSLSSSGALATDSICPKGWHLPYGSDSTGTNGGNTSGGFYYLLNSLGASSDSPLLATPYFFLRSGYYGYAFGALNNRTGCGNYQSSSAYSDNSAYYMYFDWTYIGPGTDHYGSKGDGLSIRCVTN